LAFALAALASPGCRRNDPGFELVSLEGTIEEIKRNREGTGEITVLYFSEKHGREMLGTGLVTSETEIMINGAVAKLDDLREGDRIRGDVRVDGKQGEKRRVALKIYVDRPTPLGDD
jgi:transcription termination factor Rho